MPYKIKVFRSNKCGELEDMVNDFLSTDRFAISEPVFHYSTCTAESSVGNAYHVHIVNSVCVSFVDESLPVLSADGD